MATIVTSRLETLRRARGLSQRTLAEAAGITRQAVGAIEAGRMQPSVGIALALTRALGVTVEDVFAQPAGAVPRRVAVATIAGKTVAHRLDRDYLATEPSESPIPAIFIAGCDIAAGLLSRHTMLRTRSLRAIWLEMTNRRALGALARGEVHAAVIHGNTPRRSSSTGALMRFELAVTEEGWIVARSNPRRVRGAADLVRPHVRLANRPPGAGARSLLDEQLRSRGVDPRRVAGYARELAGQLDAGRAIAQDFADAAVGMASIARLYHLDFIPLRSERCELLVPSDLAGTPEIAALIDALRSAPYRRDLEALESYDISNSGERIA